MWRKACHLPVPYSRSSLAYLLAFYQHFIFLEFTLLLNTNTVQDDLFDIYWKYLMIDFICPLDLKQELAVRQLEQKKHPEEDSNKENKQPDIVSTPTKAEHSVPFSESVTNISTSSIGTSPLHSTYGTSPLTPSARISALNIVGDLLRKVGVCRLLIQLSYYFIYKFFA